MDNSETIFPGLSIFFNLNLTCSCLYFFVVGEEDELSIKEAAELVMEGMQFTGKVEVSSVRFFKVLGCVTWRKPGGDSYMECTGMLVVSLRGVNFGFWSHLGCSGQNVIIFSRQGLVKGCT